MSNFYATFMQKQAFKRMYVEIQATNEFEARDAMHAHFGPHFMTVYDEEKFMPQISDFGLDRLCKILVINHGTAEHPSIEYKMGA